MDTSDYVIGLALFTGAALLAGAVFGKERTVKKPPKETTRWRRFRVRHGLLHGIFPEATVAVTEDPAGLRLQVAARSSFSDTGLRLEDKSQKTVIEISRGWLFRRRLRLRLLGKDLAHIRAPGPAGEPVFLTFGPDSKPYDVRGDVTGREYEIRCANRLIATVSWQRPESDTALPGEYVVESLKGMDPLPVLALVLGIEVALGPVRDVGRLKDGDGHGDGPPPHAGLAQTT